MNLKGVKKLDKAITKMVRAYICDDIRCHFNTEFAVVDENVYYSLFVDERTDNIWRAWLKDTYGDRFDDDFSTFVLSFLHEIGHYFTMDDFDDALEEKAGLVIDFDVATDEEIVEKNHTYWELPIEKAATDWAIDFYNDYKEEMKIFYRDLMAIIGDFYRKNLTDDYE